MSKAFRYLRIVFSTTCIFACVLLTALWLRSYWWLDSIHAIPNHSVNTFRGGLLFDMPLEISSLPNGPGLEIVAIQHFGEYSFPVDAISVTRGVGGVSVPFLFPTFITIVLAAAPWLRWRFSLRTLLIVTTLVAVVLGIIVWSVR